MSISDNLVEIKDFVDQIKGEDKENINRISDMSRLIDTLIKSNKFKEVNPKGRDVLRNISTYCEKLYYALLNLDEVYSIKDMKNPNNIYKKAKEICKGCKITGANHGGDLFFEGVSISQLKKLMKFGLVNTSEYRNSEGDYVKGAKKYIENTISKNKKAKFTLNMFADFGDEDAYNMDDFKLMIFQE